MNTKKLYCISHIDFDGAVAPFIIEQLTALRSNTNYEVIIKYCEFYDIDKVIEEILSQIESNDLYNSYLLFTDLVYLEENNASKINQLRQKGLNTLYIDHHVSQTIENLKERYNWIYYSVDNSKCASMQLLLIIIATFIKRLGCTTEEFIENHLHIKEQKIKDYFNNELANIFNVQNFEEFNTFIDNLMDLSNEDFLEKYESYLSNVILLVWGANLIDYRRAEELTGLKLVIKYFDIVNEYVDSSRNKSLFYIIDIMNSFPNSISVIRDDVAKLIKEYNVDERINLSYESIDHYKIIDKNQNEYLIAICFGEGDICFVVDAFRHKLKEEDSEGNLYGFISFTRIGSLDKPIFHIRTFENNTLDFIERTKKNENVFAMGSIIGVKGLFEKEVYKELTELRKEIIQLNNESKVDANKEQIKTIIKEELDKIFYKVCET